MQVVDNVAVDAFRLKIINAIPQIARILLPRFVRGCARYAESVTHGLHGSAEHGCCCPRGTGRLRYPAFLVEAAHSVGDALTGQLPRRPVRITQLKPLLNGRLAAHDPDGNLVAIFNKYRATGTALTLEDD